jgi:hypothetical protein
MTKYEINKKREALREQILLAKEHASRTTGEMRENNLRHMNAAIAALRERNRPQDGRICDCEDAPCCGHYDLD